jgi:SEC-C motif/PBS lyase HEAT-like repeat
VPHHICCMGDVWLAMSGSPEDELGAGYKAPVQQLLSIGETRSYDPSEWPDYCARFGLEREHIGDLIRMACDAALNQAESTSSEVWAPMHAWRALGQMRAEEAVLPLLALLRGAEDDEAAAEELPAVFGMIGQAAIAPLSEVLSDRSTPEAAVSTALLGIKEIAARHPECRAECVGILVRTLEPQAETDPTIRGLAVSALIDLGAVEAIDAIRDAFRRDAVDISMAGDVEDVEIALGLRAGRATPAPQYMVLPAGSLPWLDAAGVQRTTRAAAPRSAKVGRNDPCPCGSGKKYKKCCLR